MTTQEQLNNDLIKAAELGELKTVKFLVKHGADIKADNNYE
jgi:hypothetical protein